MWPCSVVIFNRLCFFFPGYHIFMYTYSWMLDIYNRPMVDSQPCCFVRLLTWVFDVCKDILSVSFFFLVIRRRRSERMTDGVDADERDKVSA